MAGPAVLPSRDLHRNGPGFVERGTWGEHHGRKPADLLHNSLRDRGHASEGMGVADLCGTRIPVSLQLATVTKHRHDEPMILRLYSGPATRSG